jgi:choline dehydrogenase-like flavoprotein
MVYTRGLKGEYDMWKASGCSGWGWDEVKRHFLMSEKCLDVGADSEVHGTLGVWLPVFHMLFLLNRLAVR